MGNTSNDSISFHGRVHLEPLLKYLHESLNRSTREVCVYELCPLAAGDRKAYEDFCIHYTRVQRAAVVDKEFDMGLCWYFVPPKLIQMNINLQLDENGTKSKNVSENNVKNEENINIADYLHLKPSINEIWMISIISIVKYKTFCMKKEQRKQKKIKMKRMKKKKKRKKIKIENEINMKLEIIDSGDSDDIDIDIDVDDDNDSDVFDVNGNDDENDDGFENDESSSEMSDDGKSEENRNKKKKSSLLLTLYELYDHIGIPLPD